MQSKDFVVIIYGFFLVRKTTLSYVNVRSQASNLKIANYPFYAAINRIV